MKPHLESPTADMKGSELVRFWFGLVDRKKESFVVTRRVTRHGTSDAVSSGGDVHLIKDTWPARPQLGLTSQKNTAQIEWPYQVPFVGVGARVPCDTC